MTETAASPSRAKWMLLTILVGGVGMWFALWTAASFDNSADLIGPGGLPEMAFYMVPLALLLVPALGLIVWIIVAIVGKISGRELGLKGVVVVIVILSLALILPAAWNFLPAHRFQSQVGYPVPASATNLHVGRGVTFNDGSAWYFSCTMSPDDFDRFCAAKGLVEKPIDWRQYQEKINNTNGHASPSKNPAFEQEKDFAGWTDYHRPAAARVFVGKRIVAVTDPDKRQIQIMIDYFRSAPR